MKAYKVPIKYLSSYKEPIEEIEIERLTDKSYYDNRGRSQRHTEYASVFETKKEAIDFAKKIANREIEKVETALKYLQDRLKRIEALKVPE